MYPLPGPRIHGPRRPDHLGCVVPAGPGGPCVLDGVRSNLAGAIDRDRSSHVSAAQCSSSGTHSARVHGDTPGATGGPVAAAPAAAAVAAAGGNAIAYSDTRAKHRQR